ncbi:MAG: hypothetical protein M1834_006507 [Cirrosporium novae-zelandiae]|nr:MAG: hypothetical protein M1834_006507 [Cirrosporium novae-zelandiae]
MKDTPNQRVRIAPAAAVHFPSPLGATHLDQNLDIEATLNVRDPVVIRSSFFTGWADSKIWKAAGERIQLTPGEIRFRAQIIEFAASASLCYITGLIGLTLVNSSITFVAPYVAVSNIFLLSLMIYAFAPVTGGHINPLITLGMTLAGLTKPARGISYIVAQTAGGALAGGLLKGGIRNRVISNCSVGSISSAEGLLIEMVCCFILLYLIFRLGLDQRQSEFSSLKMAPLLIGCALGLMTFAASNIMEDFPGASMNPARCVALAIYNGTWKGKQQNP